jgi:hypothetical protein
MEAPCELGHGAWRVNENENNIDFEKISYGAWN